MLQWGGFNLLCLTAGASLNNVRHTGAVCGSILLLPSSNTCSLPVALLRVLWSNNKRKGMMEWRNIVKLKDLVSVLHWHRHNHNVFTHWMVELDRRVTWGMRDWRWKRIYGINQLTILWALQTSKHCPFFCYSDKDEESVMYSWIIWCLHDGAQPGNANTCLPMVMTLPLHTAQPIMAGKGISMAWLLVHKHKQKLWWTVQIRATFHPLKWSPSLHITLQTNSHFILHPISHQKLTHVTGVAVSLNNPSDCLHVMSGSQLMLMLIAEGKRMGLPCLNRCIRVKGLFGFAWISSLCVGQSMTSHRDWVKFQANTNTDRE